MKLSKLREMLSKIESKHGDIDICFHDKDEACEVSGIDDCYYNTAIPRFIVDSLLPGSPIYEEEEEDQKPTKHFVVFFLS